MFGKKKAAPQPEPKPRKGKGAALMGQLGYGDMSQMETDVYGDLDDDADLEAELMALQGEVSPEKSPQRQRGKAGIPPELLMVDKMVADSLRDIPSDEEVSDTEDPDLMAELQELSTEEPASRPAPASRSVAPATENEVVSMLQERLNNYQQASDSARQTGDTSKQRRVDRGLKTLQELMKKARAGKHVDEEEILTAVAVSGGGSRAAAPAVSPPAEPPPDYPRPVPAKRAAPTPPTPAPVPQAHSSHSTADNDLPINQLVVRRDQYKKAALAAKTSNSKENAMQYFKIVKQFDAVIAAAEAGQPVDISQMPPPPPGYPGASERQVAAGRPPEVRVQRSAAQATGDTKAVPEVEVPAAPSEEEAKSLFQAPDAPKSVMEALQQRLEKYKSSEEASKAAGEGGKARRMGRIVKQYQDAIKVYKAGRPVDFEELPTPPGFAPIPAQSSPAKHPSPAKQPAPAATGGAAAPHPSPSSQSLQKPAIVQRTPSPSAPKQSRSSTEGARGASLKKSPSSRTEQQAAFLRERMEEYQAAALEAKRGRDIELAKKYIRVAKGFEPMIEAALSGLPVDMKQLPPSLKDDNDDPTFVTVNAEDCEISGDRTEVFKKLEEQLISQIRTCASNHQHFNKLGDIVNTTKFQKMEQSCRKDLDALKNAFRHGDPQPKFHYENRTFSLVQCNTDLGENDLELSMVRGIQYNPPSGYAEKDLDTFVKFEFPFPNDDPQVGHSETIKASINPEYGEPYRLQISRKARGFARVVERKSAKLEVYYKRGFLKSDKVLGTVTVKLLPLESQCTLHESYDLTDGKKSVGGKLEVKIRIRDPLKGKQVEEVKEKWLVIDQFIKTVNPKGGGAPGAVAVKTAKSDGSTCMEVLKYEKQQLDKQISYLKDSLSASQNQSLQHKSSLLKTKIDEQQAALKTGGVDAWKAYVAKVEHEIPSYEGEAQHLAKMGDMTKAQMMLTKKKLAEKELAAIRAKIPNA